MAITANMAERMERAAGRALELTRRIIEATGPRLAGGAASRKAAALLAEAAAPAADRVLTESFRVHPGAFLGFIKVLVVLYALAAPLLAFLPLLSFVLLSLGMAILVLEFFLYREPLDPFFPGLEGVNVTGILEPEGPVERQLILSGHHDSARIFTFYVDRPELYARRVYGGIGTLVAAWAAALPVALLAGPIGRVAAAVLACLAFLFVAPLWKFAAKEGTPGAGDNLEASAIALAILEEFRARRDSGSGLRSTRLLFASFDAEEAGLRGARAWARARRAEFAATPTFAYNMDCVYRKEDFRLLTTDINGSVTLDGPATALAASLAEAEGCPATVAPIAFLTGGTDAAELAKAGVRAVSLMGMAWSNEARASAYHTPADTVEAIEPAATAAAIALGIRLAEAIDAGRLD